MEHSPFVFNLRHQKSSNEIEGAVVVFHILSPQVRIIFFGSLRMSLGLNTNNWQRAMRRKHNIKEKMGMLKAEKGGNRILGQGEMVPPPTPPPTSA